MWISWSKEEFGLSFETERGLLVINGTLTEWYVLLKLVKYSEIYLIGNDGTRNPINSLDEVFELLSVKNKYLLKNKVIKQIKSHERELAEKYRSPFQKRVDKIGEYVIKTVAVFLIVFLIIFIISEIYMFIWARL